MKKLLPFLIFALVLISFVTATPSDDRTDTFISRFAENSTGIEHVVGNFTGGHEFFIQPPSNETWIISRMLVHIEDDKNWDATKYGKDIVLTNGIVIQHDKNGTITNLTNQHPVLNTPEWGSHCYDVGLYDGFTGNDFANVRWTFSKSGTYIKLEGVKNDRLVVFLNDDLSGLVDHDFLFQGYILETEEVNDNMTSLAITIFVLFITLGLYSLPFIVRKFSEHEWANIVIKRACWLVATQLMMLNGAMMMTMSSVAGLGLGNELFRYTWFFGVAGWLMTIWLLVSSVIDLLKLHYSQKREIRTGNL